MISTAIFASGALYAFMAMSFYPSWHWLPQTPEEAIAEGIAFLIMVAGVLMKKLEKIERKLDGKVE